MGLISAFSKAGAAIGTEVILSTIENGAQSIYVL
jgi:hypothetical protein